MNLLEWLRKTRSWSGKLHHPGDQKDTTTTGLCLIWWQHDRADPGWKHWTLLTLPGTGRQGCHQLPLMKHMFHACSSQSPGLSQILTSAALGVLELEYTHDSFVGAPSFVPAFLFGLEMLASIDSTPENILINTRDRRRNHSLHNIQTTICLYLLHLRRFYGCQSLFSKWYFLTKMKGVHPALLLSSARAFHRHLTG